MRRAVRERVRRTGIDSPGREPWVGRGGTRQYGPTFRATSAERGAPAVSSIVVSNPCEQQRLAWATRIPDDRLGDSELRKSRPALRTWLRARTRADASTQTAPQRVVFDVIKKVSERTVVVIPTGLPVGAPLSMSGRAQGRPTERVAQKRRYATESDALQF